MGQDMTANLTTERATFVTHLDCSMTGERYEADVLHGLSRAGFPLLVRYDLEAVGKAVSRDEIAARPTDLWRWRELLPWARSRPRSSPCPARAAPMS
jgi:threonine synthase